MVLDILDILQKADIDNFNGVAAVAPVVEAAVTAPVASAPVASAPAAVAPVAQAAPTAIAANAETHRVMTPSRAIAKAMVNSKAQAATRYII